MKFGLSSMSLFPHRIRTVLSKARQAGFDFVEIHLLGAPVFGHTALGRWSNDAVRRVVDMAGTLNLEVHFHQPYTTKGSAENEGLVLDTLTLLGMIPREGYDVSDWIPYTARPLVAYAERIDEFPCRANIWYQTIASERSDHTGVRLSREEFLYKVEKKKAHLVFDNQHDLEYAAGRHGVQFIPSQEHAVARHHDLFQRMGSQIIELHFNDYVRALGPARGRNLWPGTGSAPLGVIAELALKSPCQFVVPEVAPRLLSPYGAQELLALRKKMDEYFA